MPDLLHTSSSFVSVQFPFLKIGIANQLSRLILQCREKRPGNQEEPSGDDSSNGEHLDSIGGFRGLDLGATGSIPTDTEEHIS